MQILEHGNGRKMQKTQNNSKKEQAIKKRKALPLRSAFLEELFLFDGNVLTCAVGGYGEDRGAGSTSVIGRYFQAERIIFLFGDLAPIRCVHNSPFIITLDVYSNYTSSL